LQKAVALLKSLAILLRNVLTRTNSAPGFSLKKRPFLKRGASNVSDESNAGSERQPRQTRSMVMVGRDLVGRYVDLVPALSALKH